MAHGPAAEPLRTRSPIAATSAAAAVLVIVLLFGLLLFQYSVVTPLFRGPDEGSHLDLVRGVRAELGYPAYLQLEGSTRLRRAGELSHFRAARPVRLTTENVIPRDSRPTFDELGPPTTTGNPNRLTQNPPLYYALVGSLVTLSVFVLPDADAWSFDVVVAVTRGINALFVLPIPLLAYLTARRLGAAGAAAVVAALVPLTIPQFLHIGSVVNNDNLLTLFGAAQTWLLVTATSTPHSDRRAVMVGLVSGGAMLTKVFGLMFPVWALAVYALIGRRRSWQETTRAMTIVAAVSFAAGGWWWLRNLLTLGILEPSSAKSVVSPEGFSPDLLSWLTRYGAWMTARFWGWFGWFDTRLPVWIVVVMTGLLLGAVGMGVKGIVRRHPDASSALMATLFPLPVLLVGVAVQAYDSYAQSGATPAIQGRYLFSGLVGLAAVAAIGVATSLERARAAVAVMVALVAAMHFAAARAFLGAYWGPAGGSIAEQIEAMLAWSPWPSAGVIAAAVVAAGLVGVLVTLLVGRRWSRA